MSLSTQESPKTYPIAILAAKNLDDPSFLEEQIGGSLSSISHIYTNGANSLVGKYASDSGLPHTVFPLTHSNLLKSTGLILEQVKFVYIISTPDSKSTKQIEEMCKKKGTKYRVINYEPYTHWAEKVVKVSEILTCMTKEDLEKNEYLKALWRVV